MKGFICGSFAVFLMVTCVSYAPPQPAIVPGPDDWTVEVRYENPQQILVKLSGDTKPRRFWYIIMTLTNETNRDVDFYPECDLVTDTFQIIPAGKSVPETVFEQIKRLYQNRYPFLELVERVDTKILQGQDNTKDIVIIWPDFDDKAKGMKLFTAGLSNETVAIDHPTAKDQTGKPVKVFLRKTLELDYKLGGDATFRSDAKLILQNKCWVMR
jgi:hypothetical protein